MQSKKPFRKRINPEAENKAPSRGRSTHGPRAAALALLGNPLADREEQEEDLHGLDPRDRALASAIACGSLRMRGTIDYFLGHFLRQEIANLPEPVLNILRSAVFQMQFLDRVPDYAVVSESVELAKRIYGGRYQGLVNAVLRRLGREWDSVPLPSFEEEPIKALAVRHSHPEWLVERWLLRFGADEAVALLEANNARAPLVVRVRPTGEGMEKDSARMMDLFRGAGIKVNRGEYAPEALVLAEASSPSRLPGFERGLFYAQDEAAMLVGRLAAPSPGTVALDLCAAPGGKCTHMAELAGNTALVIAADQSMRRLETLGKNIARLAANSIRIVSAEARRAPFRKADLVLCDVPCTGTGALRRKPDLRWRITPADLQNLAALQREIISAAAELVCPGGALVYSTCSLELEENAAVVEWFLERNSDFRLEPAGRRLIESVVQATGYLETFPHRHGIDGTFGARFRRLAGA